jgi:hypothetical protein
MKFFFVALIAFSVSILAARPCHAKPESWYLNTSGVIAIRTLYPSSSGITTGQPSVCDFIAFLCKSGGNIGIYKPAGKNLLVGITLLAFWDFTTQIGGIDKAVTQAQIGAGTLYFTGKEPGEGFYLRGDLGRAEIGLGQQDGAVGLGSVLGAGFSFSMNEDTHYMLGLNYQRKDAGKSLFQAFLFEAGFLF